MTVRYGTPITTTQATQAILREIRSPILGDVTVDSGPSHTFSRIYKERADHGDDSLYDMLSSRERRLVDIAFAIWRSSDTEGASIGAIGGLDWTLRRKVLIILAYLHLGADYHFTEWDEATFAEAFGNRS